MKTVSLELSKQLKEAGYPQEGKHWWALWTDHSPSENKDCHELHYNLVDDYDADFVSPTADEILDQLPDELRNSSENAKHQLYFLTISRVGLYEVGYENVVNETFIATTMEDKSLADAAAKMWLYLKKEGLL